VLFLGVFEVGLSSLASLYSLKDIADKASFRSPISSKLGLDCIEPMLLFKLKGSFSNTFFLKHSFPSEGFMDKRFGKICSIK